jgi:hypothetical protein
LEFVEKTRDSFLRSAKEFATISKERRWVLTGAGGTETNGRAAIAGECKQGGDERITLNGTGKEEHCQVRNNTDNGRFERETRKLWGEGVAENLGVW